MSISATQGYQLEIDKLLQSINSSAERLRGKNNFDVFQELQNNIKTTEIKSGQAYLEPKASFSVQEYISANPWQESATERYKQSLYKKQEKKENFEPLKTSRIDFTEILKQIGAENKVDAYEKVSQNYIAPQKENSINTTIMNMNKEFSYATLDYAVNSYTYVQEINHQPHILIDFMHEYNRNFNFEA